MYSGLERWTVVNHIDSHIMCARIYGAISRKQAMTLDDTGWTNGVDVICGNGETLICYRINGFQMIIK